MTERERAAEIAREKRVRWIQNLVLVTALLLALGALVGVWFEAQARAESAERAAVSLAQQVQEACAAEGLPVEGGDLCERADEVAENPDAPTVPPVGAAGDDAPGLTASQVLTAVAVWCSTHDCTPRPTPAQVADALADYCSDHSCRGPAGENGEDGDDSSVPGPPPTAEQIAAEVATYCADGACRGTDGDDGDDSTVPGPPPTAEQIQAEVIRYCETRNQCQGPKGDTGDAGGPGKDGVGIKSIACPQPEDDWVITYTDGTTQTVAGPCRAEPIVVDPTPSPSPSPSPLE